MEVTEITSEQTAETGKALLIAAIIIVALIVIIIIAKKIISLFSEDPEVKKTREQNQKDYEKEKDKILSNQAPVHDSLTLQGWADQIHEDLKYSSVSDEKGDAEDLLKRPDNDADFILLRQYFGTRNEWYFGIPMGSSEFVPYVTSNLSRERLDSINDTYQKKGIKFRW